jgi:hypothetical protein
MSRKILVPKLSKLIDVQALAGGDKPHSRQAKKIRSHLWRVEVMRLD